MKLRAGQQNFQGNSDAADWQSIGGIGAWYLPPLNVARNGPAAGGPTATAEGSSSKNGTGATSVYGASVAPIVASASASAPEGVREAGLMDSASQHPVAEPLPPVRFGSGATVSGISGSTAVSPAASASVPTNQAAPASPTIGSAAVPSWISALTDAVLKTDMTAASAGGAVSETAMARLFSDLGAELTASKTTLSAGQISDLKTIAADLNVGETASSYVTYVANALIGGNAANAKWTGGAASTGALGNLAVGSTATQVVELDGKWFLGTDLPSSTVAMSGAATFSVSYSAVANPAFGAGGPSMNDINQGYLGDCYMLASLAEVAKQEPSLIQSMITNNGNNTYGVRFFYGGSAQYVTVNDSLADGGGVFNSGTNIWASLVEKAYAQVQASGDITGNNVNYGNSFSTIGNGGAPEYALEEITGASTITDFYANGSSWSRYAYSNTFSVQSASSGFTTASVLATLATDLAGGSDVVLSSRTQSADSRGYITLVANHALSIYGYDSATGQLEIRNPWGTESGQYWDTTFEVSLNTLLADGDTISIDNMTASGASVVTGALVSAAAGLQANTAITSFSVCDSWANVSTALTVLAGDTKLSSIALTGVGTAPLALTAAQYSTDVGILAKITGTYTLTVSGATVSVAAGLQTNPMVTSFTVSDSWANVGTALTSLAADTKLSSVVLTGAGTAPLALTAAQYSADAGILAKIAGTYALTVSGAAASGAAGLQSNPLVTSFTVSDSSANVAANIATLNSLGKLQSIAVSDSNPLALTYTQFTAYPTALGKLPGTYTASVSGVAYANAGVMQGNAHVASFSVSDSWANVSTALTILAGDTKLSSVVLTGTGTPPLALTAAQYAADAAILAKIAGTYALTVSGAAASAAGGLQTNPMVTSFTVSDSWANVGTALAILAANTKLSSVALTGPGTPPLALTAAQYSADAGILAKIAGTYALTVSGAAASAAGGLQTNPMVTSFTVSDSSANVAANIATLNGLAKLQLTALSDSNPLALNYTQFTAYPTVLGKLPSTYTASVTGVTYANAGMVQGNAHVKSFAVSDSWTNVSAALTVLAADTKLTSVVLTGSGTPPLALTGTQYIADAGVLAKIIGTYALTVTGAAASAAGGLQTNPMVTSFTVSDSSANVAANIATLNSLGKLQSIAVSDSNPLALTYAQFTTYQTALGRLPSTYTVSVNGASVADAGTLQAKTHVGSFGVSDTAANVTAAITQLNADGKLSSLAIGGTTSGDTVLLTGSGAAATINLNGDTASMAASSLTLPKLTFIGTPDAITLGTGASVIDYTLQSSSGVETIANFQFGLDHLDINLNSGTLQAADATCNGQSAITLCGSADKTHGVVLTNVGGMTAGAMTASHITVSAGHALIT